MPRQRVEASLNRPDRASDRWRKRLVATNTPVTRDTAPLRAPSADAIMEQVDRLAAEFALERTDRQRRRELDPSDFDRIRQAGFHLACLPTEFGGLWAGSPRSSRLVLELLRTLARGDSS